MSLFRGSKDATVLTGNTVATTADIAAALEETIAAKDSAEAAQAATLVNLEKLNETYLGAKSTNPSVDNNGDPLTDGAIYYNTDNQITRVYDESADTWLNLNFTSDELNNINILGPIAGDIETVVGIDTDVTTVAGISSQVTTVADNEQDVDTVSSSISSVEVIASDLAGAGFDYDLGSITQATEGVVGVPDGYIITVFNIRDDITTVSGIESDVTTVSSINSDVTTTANNIADVQTVASDLNSVTSDIDTVSTNITSINTVSTNISDVSTVSGINTEVQTVSGIDSDVSNVSSISSDVTKISGISTDVSTVSGISSDVSTVASNVTDVTNFADVYIGPATSDPTARSDGSGLQTGDLYFNTNDGFLKVYDGTQWNIGTVSIDQEVNTDSDVIFNSVTANEIDCGSIV